MYTGLHIIKLHILPLRSTVSNRAVVLRKLRKFPGALKKWERKGHQDKML
jgi:hypothetical protein